jgi:hypothetical protein
VYVYSAEYRPIKHISREFFITGDSVNCTLHIILRRRPRHEIKYSHKIRFRKFMETDKQEAKIKWTTNSDHGKCRSKKLRPMVGFLNSGVNSLVSVTSV